MLYIFIFISIMLLPGIAHAWGTLTHVFLGNQVLEFGAAVIPAGIYGLIKKFKNDFIYGNLSADIIIGKRLQEYNRNSHSWDTAWELMSSAKTDSHKAFAYGYLTHLSADTVVHNLKKSSLPFTHPILEIKSDSIVDKKYRIMLKRVGFDKITQQRNDVLLEDMLESQIFSFKTNKRIFRGFLVLSRIPSYTHVSNFIDRRLPNEMPAEDIYKFQQESLKRMIELLSNGKDSEVLRKNPMKLPRRRASKYS